MNLKATILLFLSASIINAQELPSYWSKSLIGPQRHVGNVDRRAFVIFLIGYGLDGYYAHCGFSNQSSDSVRLIGATDKSGQFYSKATLLTSETQDGPWRKAADVTPAGRETTLIVKPHTDSESVIIGLNELFPLIDKFAYAKICLPTGEATIFAIKELKHKQK